MHSWADERQNAVLSEYHVAFRFGCLELPEWHTGFQKLPETHSRIHDSGSTEHLFIHASPMKSVHTTYGDRSFAVSGPTTWNSLPVALRSSDAAEETFLKRPSEDIFVQLFW